MAILRTLGVLFTLLGFVALTYDGARAIASPDELAFASLHEHWMHLSSASQEKTQASLERLGVPGLCRPALSGVLDAPAWASLGSFGLFLYWLGYRRERRAVEPE
jgi:hypothetical protein